MKKNPLLSYQFWNDVSLAQDQTSAVFDIRYQDNMTIQLNCSGTPSGVFYVQGSNDYQPVQLGGTRNTGTWVNIDDASATVTTSGNIIFEINQLGCHFIRVFWDFTASTGTVDGFIVGKQV